MNDTRAFLVDMIVGPLFYRTFVTRAAITDATLRRLVDAAIATHREPAP